MTRCVIFLLLRNVIQSVSFTWHLGLVLVIIPSHSFPTREASQFSTLVTAVLANARLSLTSLEYFFVVMMIESAEFLWVFIAVIRSDVSTVPVTDQSMTYHNTILYTMYYLYVHWTYTEVDVSTLTDDSLQKRKGKLFSFNSRNIFIYISKDLFI